MSTRSKLEIAFWMTIILGIVGIVAINSNIPFPTANAAVIEAHGEDNATPYLRYARPVRPACGTSLVFEGMEVSKGGGTYSEMVYYFGAPCNVAGYIGASSLVATATPEPIIKVTVTPPTTVTPPAPTPPPPPPAGGCDGGNPGNTKCNGNAGEDPNGKGTMPKDNAGGNGNGAHGNQGQGGNGGGNGNGKNKGGNK